MRIVQQIVDEASGGASLRPLRRSDENTARLAEWATSEVNDALAARAEQEREWRDGLRRYEAVPRQRLRDTPVENAPNIEVALGAIACDSLYAQTLDTIFNIAPLVTIRPVGTDKEVQASAAALQRRVDHGVDEWGFRPAMETAALDVIQLGTGGIHTPFVEQVRKTDMVVVKERGPRLEAWPLEDILFPGGARTDVQRMTWVGLRAWYTPGELDIVARRSGWNVEGWMPTASLDYVRTQRETLGRHRTNKHASSLYEVIHFYAHVDYDGDGEDEDLYFVFDRASSRIGLVRYNPYDTRPLEVARYQLRAHLAYGQGVLEMTRPGQETVTELMNAALLNVALSNIPVIAVRQGAVDDQQKLWAAKLVPCMDPVNDFVPKQLAMVNPQTAAYITMNMALVERRTGVNDMSLPRPSAVMGSRTPGITTMSMLQQTNRRFTPAFDQIRLMGAGAVMQCLYREQEMLLAGDLELEAYYQRLLGPEDAQRVIDLLRDPTFDEQVTVELTASSASVNREADRQSAILLVNILGQYYDKAFQLVQFAANPGIPQPVRDVAKKIADAATAIIERTVRTFDIARDPSTFVIDMDTELDALASQLDPVGMAGLANMLGMLGGPAGGPGGPDGGGAPPIGPDGSGAGGGGPVMPPNVPIAA